MSNQTDFRLDGDGWDARLKRDEVSIEERRSKALFTHLLQQRFLALELSSRCFCITVAVLALGSCPRDSVSMGELSNNRAKTRSACLRRTWIESANQIKLLNGRESFLVLDNDHRVSI